MDQFPRPTKRRRAARVARWTGLVLCVLLGVAWIVSIRWTLYLTINATTPHSSLGISSSGLFIEKTDVQLMHWLNMPVHTSGNEPLFGFYRNLGANDPQHWLPDYSASGIPPVSQRVVLPIWMILACVGIPTGLLWNAALTDARRRALIGKCHACGYDRAGLNTDAPCPECGEGTNR